MNKLESMYFNWIVKTVSDSEHIHGYKMILEDLYARDFTWTIIFDENLADQGIRLRDRYLASSKTARKLADIYGPIDKPCSILEMMVSLALSCEENVMQNYENNRTRYWFWSMIESMGLDIYDDFSYDEAAVCDILDRFLARNYDKNGRGGLFTLQKSVKNDQKDMRNIDIWMQMNAWLIDNFESKT